jgi:hypothetical protein
MAVNIEFRTGRKVSFPTPATAYVNRLMVKVHTPDAKEIASYDVAGVVSVIVDGKELLLDH